MRILMVTNTFTPHVGGVARSIETFTKSLRENGHHVLTIAPTFEDSPEHEQQVVKVPAKQRFNGSDFSVVYPFGDSLAEAVRSFAPDLVHSHHPFLLGGTALRMARVEDVPLIFTHHTMYEQFTQYVPGDSPALKRFCDPARHQLRQPLPRGHRPM
jgi:glycosyltransferase involved in cell wall biosynthesis